MPLVFHKEELLALEQRAKRTFEHDLATRLQKTHPRLQFEDVSEAVFFVHAEIGSALTHAIESKKALAKYVEASWLMGGPVDADPHVRSMLARPDLAPYVRALFAWRIARGEGGYYGLW